MDKSVSKLTPALIGGAVIGILSSTPFINAGNCLCCMWVLLGGAVGAYAYKRQLPARSELSAGEGALVGLLSGIFGSLFGALLSYLFLAIFGEMAFSFVRNLIMSRSEDVTPEVKDWLETLMKQGGFNLLWVLVKLFFELVVYSIFGTLGGMIGAALFGKKKPAGK